jgi:fatty-acyl-CoA synthase
MKETSNDSIWLADTSDSTDTPLTLGDALNHAAKAWPQNDAVIYSCQPDVEETRWSYETLNTMAQCLADSLLSYGYTPGDKVAVWGPNHPQWVLLEYAFAKAGLVIVALNPLYKRSELAYALNASEVVGIFYADNVAGNHLIEVIDLVKPAVPTLRWTHSFSRGINDLLKRVTSAAWEVSVDPSDIFMIQYTSGTTGNPKATQLTHAAITTTAANSYRRWGFREGSRVCHGFPLFHVGGSGNSIPGAMLTGGTTLPLYIFRADKTLDILEKENCHGFIGVPTMLTMMLDDPSFASRDFSALDIIVTGGALVPEYLVRRCEEQFGAEVLNCYGQTETCGVTSSTMGGDSREVKTQSSGKPLDGVSVKVVDPHGRILPIGKPGEILYKGPGQMLAYRDAQANQDAFDSNDWLRSGDLGIMDSSGNISVVGRKKEMIIRGGENLSPAEIEHYLLEHPDIASAAVIAIPDAKYGEEVCAVICPQDHIHSTAEDIKAWCSERVSRWKVPRYIIFMDELPMTHSGKVKKYVLKEQVITLIGHDISGAKTF